MSDIKSSLPQWSYTDSCKFSARITKKGKGTFFIVYTCHSNAFEGNSISQKENLLFLCDDLSAICK